MNVLVIGAHPDDEVYGCGGALYKHHLRGDRTFVLIVTDGCQSQYPGRPEMVEQKISESRKVQSILHISDYFFPKLPDMKLDTIPHVELNRTIAAVVEAVEPDIVYTHHWGDVNKDHRMIFESTMVVVRPNLKRTISEVYLYETPSSSEWNVPDSANTFMPNVYLDIGDVMDKKLEALSAYQSELRAYPHPRSVQAIKSYCNRNGITVLREYCECFLLARKVH